MDPFGLQSVSSINALAKSQTGLQLSQQVTAQILDVQGTTVVLSIEGVPIVAQLTSPGQAAMLLSRHSARFVVAQLTNQRMTLKMIGGEPPEAMADNTASSREELATRVLEQNNIPITSDNLTMARAVLKQHLPITAHLLTELSEALGKSGSVDAAKANLAAALKASNLPATSQSIELASRQPAKIGNSISYISKMVADLTNQDVPDEILNDLKFVLGQLGGYIPDEVTDVSKRGEQLKVILEALGKSLENMLLSQSQDGDVSQSETGLLSLARLQQALKLAGKNEVAAAVGEFLEDLRAAQFLNARSDWLEIHFALHNTKADQDFSSPRLRILRDDKTHSGTINSCIDKTDSPGGY